MVGIPFVSVSWAGPCSLNQAPFALYGLQGKISGVPGVTRVIPAHLLSTPDVMLLGLNWFNKMTHIIFIPEQFFNYSTNTKKFVSE